MCRSISDQYPDLVTRLYVQIRLICNFGFSACVPWTIRADESLILFVKLKTTYIIFFLIAPIVKKSFDSLKSFKQQY